MRRWLARLGLVVTSALFVCLAGEVAVRGLTDTRPPLILPDSRVALINTPDFDGDVHDAESGETVHLRFNREGFRGPTWKREHTGATRVAMLGDSMVVGVGVGEVELLTTQLQTALASERPGQTWEVMNLGVPAASPATQLVLWREILRAYTPDIVLATFFVGNDLSDDCACLDNFPRIYFELDASGALIQRPFSAGRGGVSAWLNRKSRLYVWQKDAINRTLKGARKASGKLENRALVYATNPGAEATRAWAITGAIFSTFRKEVEATGAKFGVVVLTDSAQIYADRFASLTGRAHPEAEFSAEEPEKRMNQLAQSGGFWSLDLTYEFRNAAPSADSKLAAEQLYFNGHGHFNPRGHALAASAIARWMARTGFLDAQPPAP